MAAAVLMATVSFRDENVHDDWQALGRDEAKKKKILVKQTSMMQSEREISMDPKSIRSLSLSGSMRRSDSFDMILLPAISPPRDLDAPLPLPLQPVRTKFVSRSLPNSTTTSPKQRSGQMRSIKSKVQDSSSSAYRRSKSCGSTSKRLSLKSSGIRNSFFIKSESNKSINNNTLEDGFKCNALCLYLPGFSKGKPVRASRKDESSSLNRTTRRMTSSSSSVTVSRTVSVRETTTTTTVISARASLEKFDCGSYTLESGGEGGGHFDLPSELIKTGSGENDQDDPVSAAFLFDKEPTEKEIKGVLKMSGSKNRKSMESPRHVRFSTSSLVSYPTSPAISPRLLEATKNFNAFLIAQAI